MKFIIISKMSFDSPPKEYYEIVEILLCGLWFTWPGIYSTAESAKMQIYRTLINHELREKDSIS